MEKTAWDIQQTSTDNTAKFDPGIIGKAKHNQRTRPFLPTFNGQYHMRIMRHHSALSRSPDLNPLRDAHHSGELVYFNAREGDMSPTRLSDHSGHGQPR